MTTRHLMRIVSLMAFAGVLLGWVFRHSEASLNTGLRSIQEARRIEHGSIAKGLTEAVNHPIHPLAIAISHRLVFAGDSPTSWQRAAVFLAIASTILWMIPLYLLSLELGGGRTAWLACILAIANPTICFVAVNTLSESLFLVWWTWGLWASIRFLRGGRFTWLSAAVGFGTLAYWTRPEGLLLPMALAATLILLPFNHSTRINWPRWSWALALLIVGSSFLAGPYMALKGSLGTRPAIARVLGLAPPAHPLGLEREHPLDLSQNSATLYGQAIAEVARKMINAVGLSTVPFSLLGALAYRPWRVQPRSWLLFSTISVVSILALIRLYGTGGYCADRHALIPAIFAILLAARGWDWLIDRVVIPATWFRADRIGTYRPGPLVWLAIIGMIAVLPSLRGLGPVRPGPFWIYRTGADYLKALADQNEKVLDLTDWSTFFSQHPGYCIDDLFEDPAALTTRWIVVASPFADTHRATNPVIAGLIGDQDPLIAIPPLPANGQIQLRIYDRSAPAESTQLATTRD